MATVYIACCFAGLVTCLDRWKKIKKEKEKTIRKRYALVGGVKDFTSETEIHMVLIHFKPTHLCMAKLGLHVCSDVYSLK